MKTCLIVVKIGDPIQEIGGKQRRGILHSMSLMPNGINSPELVTVIIMHYGENGKLQATADKFTVVDDFNYESEFPSVELINS